MVSGNLFIVGIGPGNKRLRTLECEDVIKSCDVIVGYNTYVQLISDLIEDQEVISSGMKKELDRALVSLEKIEEGKNTVVISSGDSGVYGMAGLLYELCDKKKIEPPIRVIPGVTAANACGNVLGAPLMCDYAVISLSDLLIPWEQIENRITKIAQADMVLVLYNPKSKKRITQLEKTIEILKQYHDDKTPVGIVKNISLDREETIIADLSSFPFDKVDMRSTVIIGNSQTRIMNNKIITPRGYEI